MFKKYINICILIIIYIELFMRYQNMINISKINVQIQKYNYYYIHIFTKIII